MSNLYCYKMTHDQNHAPCILDNVLSIAVCKKKIRARCKVGDWLVGFSSKQLKDARGIAVGTGKFVFAARVDEKMSFREYLAHTQYAARYDYQLIADNFRSDGCSRCADMTQYNLDTDNVILSANFYHTPENNYPPIPAHLQYLVPECRDYRLFSAQDAAAILKFIDTLK